MLLNFCIFFYSESVFYYRGISPNNLKGWKKNYFPPLHYQKRREGFRQMFKRPWILSIKLTSYFFAKQLLTTSVILLFAASKGKETFISIAISVVLLVSIPSVIFSYLFTSNVSKRASITLCSLTHHHRTDREFLKCSLVEKKLNTKYLQKLPEEKNWWNLLECYNMLLCIFYFSICVLQSSV